MLEAKLLLQDCGRGNPWEGVGNVCSADGEKHATKDANPLVQFAYR